MYTKTNVIKALCQNGTSKYFLSLVLGLVQAGQVHADAAEAVNLAEESKTEALNAAGKPLKVFIFAGQSNMVGKRSIAKELPENLKKAQARAFFFSGKEWVNIRPGVTEKRGFGPEISFAERMTKSLGEPIGIIKHSVGGTSLAASWNPNSKTSLYAKLVALTVSAKKKRTIKIVGMVWAQGGADAKKEKSAKAYKANLINLVNKARKDFASPNMFFVCARSAVGAKTPIKKFPHANLIRESQAGVKMPGYVWVDCDTLPKGKDNIHFNTTGQVQAGYLYADAMLKLLKKAK